MEKRKELKERVRGDTHSLLRLSNPEKAPLVSSIVPDMSLWSSSLWRMREKRGIRKMEGGREEGEQGQALPALKRYTALAEDGLEVMGYPFTIFPSPLPPYINFPLCTWPEEPLCRSALPTKSIPSLEGVCAFEYACMCVDVSRQTQHNKFIIDDGIIGGNTTTGPVCLSVFERLGG